MGKVKKKVNLGVLGMSPYISKGVPQSCLDPTYGCQKMFMIFLHLSLIFWKFDWFVGTIWVEETNCLYMKNKMSNLNAMTFTLKSIVSYERLGLNKSF
jgi:hypothetical protein